MELLENPDGQMGSYFGGVVCMIDVDGDGWDELLVGAPRHSKVKDEGRVYVYTSVQSGRLQHITTLTGEMIVGEGR